MNWQTVSFDWNQARAFLATVEEGSLSAAARALGVTQPTLGRQVAALEAALGVVLFERVGRSLRLTDAGLELLDHVREMYAAANRISLTASGRSQSVEGLVRITASDVASAYFLPAIMVQLRQVAPLLDIEIIAANDVRDLQLREADIAIRHVRPDQPDLIARKIETASAGFYAARSYLDQFGRPDSLAELSSHEFIGMGDNRRFLDVLNGLGLSLTQDNIRLNSASGIVSWELARSGLGVAVMSDAVAATDPNMERLLPDMTPITFPVWLTVHRELHTSRRIRLVFDLLADALTLSAPAR